MERFPIEMEAIGADRDHIPLLCGTHPKVAPGRMVQIFKRLTCREIFRRKPAVKRELPVKPSENLTEAPFVAA